MKARKLVWLLVTVAFGITLLGAVDFSSAQINPSELGQVTLVNPPDVPPCGTFWLLKGPNRDYASPPHPCVPLHLLNLGVPIYRLQNGQFLIDDSQVDYSAMEEYHQMDTALRSLEQQYGLAVPDPGDGTGEGDLGGDPGTGSTPIPKWTVVPGLYLMQPAVQEDGTLFLGLTNTDPNLVVTSYDLFQNAGLEMPRGWRWLARSESGQMGFVVSSNWAGTDRGFFMLCPTNDTDWDGFSDAAEQFITGTDPTVADVSALGFKVTFAHEVYNTHIIPASLVVTSGYPTFMAVLVDATNFDGAAWAPLSTNFPVNLGTGDGLKQIWVGLAGPTPDVPPVWQARQVTLDQTPPELHVTSPTALTSSRPMIQLQGYSTEPVSGIYFDVSNGAGQLTNQQGLVKSQDFDPVAFKFTTNYFQCYDVDLAEGTNIITVRAADLAGNVAVTNYTYVFSTNYVTAAPAIQLTWPQDGMKLCGDSFTVRGQLDDPTVRLTASLSNTNGTQFAPGLVARYGQFWVENLSLAPGTNILTLSATNAAGLSTTTNLTLVKSDTAFTMAEVPESQLHQSTVLVTGTVPDDTYAVWVNGQMATVDGSGAWSVTVPVPEGGTAGFYAAAYPAGEHPDPALAGGGSNPPSGNALGLAAEQDKQPEVRVMSYVVDWELAPSAGGSGPRSPRIVVAPGSQRYHLGWTNMAASSGYKSVSSVVSGCRWDYVWPPDVDILRQQAPSLAGIGTNDCGQPMNTNVGPPTIYLEHCCVTNNVLVTNSNPVTTNCYWRTAQTQLQLFTGGKGLSRRMSLFAVQAPTFRILSPRWPVVPDNLAYEAIVATNVIVGNLGRLSADGMVYRGLPDNEPVEATVKVENENFYTFDVLPQKYTVEIHRIDRGDTKVSELNSVVSVGEKVSLLCKLAPDGGPPIASYQWTIPGLVFSNYVADYQTGRVEEVASLTDPTVSYYWRDSTNAPVQCTVQVMGVELSNAAPFSVKKPSANIVAQVVSSVAVDSIWKPGAIPALHFGFNEGTVGIRFSYTTDAITPGRYQWVQVGHEETQVLSHDDNQWYIAEGDGVDTTYPCKKETVNNRELESTSDSPGWGPLQVDPEVKKALYCTLHLMFQPLTYPEPQWVSLKTIDWGWYGDAVISNGAFVLADGGPYVAPVVVDATNNPTWTSNITNSSTTFHLK